MIEFFNTYIITQYFTPLKYLEKYLIRKFKEKQWEEGGKEEKNAIKDENENKYWENDWN